MGASFRFQTWTHSWLGRTSKEKKLEREIRLGYYPLHNFPTNLIYVAMSEAIDATGILNGSNDDCSSVLWSFHVQKPLEPPCFWPLQTKGVSCFTLSSLQPFLAFNPPFYIFLDLVRRTEKYGRLKMRDRGLASKWRQNENNANQYSNRRLTVLSRYTFWMQ